MIFSSSSCVFHQVAALITLFYLMYQYRGYFFKTLGDDDLDHHGCRLSRSRSRSLHRSRSRSRTKGNYHEYKIGDSKHRRGRKPTRRCPDCSLCNSE
ncbi:unnamed protein product [Danaus chrysippus]|uniref:(African queen) hypothetical protein n=1 Tax=Danaus chrysippus TaxID=151541 RepID=A0A8J2W8L1_9NEOP|nr:unnamed protein product [Danaus chrysippus]